MSHRAIKEARGREGLRTLLIKVGVTECAWEKPMLDKRAVEVLIFWGWGNIIESLTFKMSALDLSPCVPGLMLSFWTEEPEESY